MFVDELSTRDSLVRMVRKLTANVALREDLLQEALIHLWLTETRRPGQTRSWYLQSCKYHLLHYLASGRSVDSGKRRAGQFYPSDDSDEWETISEKADSGNTVLNSVSARDIISLLSPQLLPHEKAVLHCFAEGLGPREIGRKLNMSHTMVIKHRRKIALLFHRLELPKNKSFLPRFSASPRTRTNAHAAANGKHSRVIPPSQNPLSRPVSPPGDFTGRLKRLNGEGIRKELLVAGRTVLRNWTEAPPS
jgi:DNA-directed RNA polymerase specialized sigma24 family protein